MTIPAAKKGDTVVAIDTHLVSVAGPSGTAPTPVPAPFVGKLTRGLSPNVIIEHKPAATVMSIADNNPPHVAVGGTFQRAPSNEGRIITGSGTVHINNLPAARDGDVVETCNDPADAPRGIVVCGSSVLAALS